MRVPAWILACLFAGLGLRVVLAYHGHSGLGKPPMHGDFEAQRHWVEITNALPPVDWYRNTTDNDLQYWGLDYPPLSAWHARIIVPATRLVLRVAGALSESDIDALLETAFGLHTSRGNEAVTTIAVMRGAAWVTDVVFYVLPALWLLLELRAAVGRDALKAAHQGRQTLAAALQRQGGATDAAGKKAAAVVHPDDADPRVQPLPLDTQLQPSSDEMPYWWGDAFPAGSSRLTVVSAAMLLFTPPAQVWIDHGHFQFNAAALGPLVACTAIFVRIARNESLKIHASPLWEMLFCVLCAGSIMFKQMSLYFSLAMAATLLERIVTRVTGPARSWSDGLAALVLGGCGGLTTIFACLAPPLIASDVLTRMFPFNRGLYEDKVANLWCAISPVLKLPRLFSNQQALVRFCALSTVAAATPAVLAFVVRRMAPLLRRRSSVNAGAPLDQVVRFGLVLAASSLSFFLFSFQVHEKGIMMPACGLTIAGVVAALASPDTQRQSLFRDGRGLVHMAVHFHAVALFSMAPLAVKDEHMPLPFLPVFALLSIWSHRLAPAVGTARVVVTRLSLLAMVCVLVLHAVYEPPEQLPDIVTLLYSAVACGHFLIFLGWVTLLLAKR